MVTFLASQDVDYITGQAINVTGDERSIKKQIDLKMGIFMEEKEISFRLDGKKALITGAARGIGKAISLAFAEHGADLALIDFDQEPLEVVVKQIKKLGRKVLPIVADISKIDQIRKLTKRTLQELGWVDILVNNAGIGINKPAEKLTVEDWDKVLAVNLKGSFFLSQIVGKHMIKRKSGKIINISSQAGVVGIEELAAYGASKAGVILYTKVLAVEWGKFNINVNAIAPTSIKTRQAHPGKAGEELVRKTPLGRMGEPEDVAGVALFLASNASDMVSGATIMVDGGYTAR